EHLRHHRQLVLVEDEREGGVLDKFVGDGADAAARCVAHPSRRRRCGKQCLDEFVHGRGVGGDVGVDGQVAAGQHDGHPVLADRPRQHHLVAGPHEAAGQLPAFGDHADARGGDVDTVGSALADNLRVAGDDLHTRLRRGFAHVGDDFAEFGDFEALLDDERRRQPLWPRARHREVIDRSVDGDVADGSARKAPRRNDKRVGREREPFTRCGAQDGGVTELFEFFVAKRLEEHRVDQRRRRLAARPVRERHHIVEQPWSALPELVDPLQHAVFAVRRGAHAWAPDSGRAMCSWVTDHSRYPSIAWLSCMRWMLCECTVKQKSRSSAAAILPPSCPDNPMVTSPRCFASVIAVIRSSELPDVDNAIATSRSRPWAMIWRLKISSNPTSLPSAVTTASSAASDQAATGRPRAGRLNSDASVAASVELPPLPSVYSRPPFRNRSAISIPAAVSASSYSSSDAFCRRALSVALPRADAARSSSKLLASVSSDSMNGYRKLVLSVSDVAGPADRESCVVIAPPPQRRSLLFAQAAHRQAGRSPSR